MVRDQEGEVWFFENRGIFGLKGVRGTGREVERETEKARAKHVGSRGSG